LRDETKEKAMTALRVARECGEQQWRGAGSVRVKEWWKVSWRNQGRGIGRVSVVAGSPPSPPLSLEREGAREDEQKRQE